LPGCALVFDTAFFAPLLFSAYFTQCDQDSTLVHLGGNAAIDLSMQASFPRQFWHIFGRKAFLHHKANPAGNKSMATLYSLANQHHTYDNTIAVIL